MHRSIILPLPARSFSNDDGDSSEIVTVKRTSRSRDSPTLTAKKCKPVFKLFNVLVAIAVAKVL